MSRPDLYFSLIHARASFANEWVERFYRRLDEEVRSLATPPPGLRAGSVHHLTERDARQAFTMEPQAVRVLVPLYTREFLHDPPPDFAPYLARRSGAVELPFVHPVMWDVYVPPREVYGIAQALSLGRGIREYEDCGMATICRLNAYAVELREIVELLAARIVRAAEHPSHLPDWMPIEAPAISAPSAEAAFLISLVRSAGSDPEWTPFEPERFSVIERAVRAARGFRLLPEIVDVLAGAPSPDEARDSAGILLLDPATLIDPGTRPVVEKLLRRLPQWTAVVVVTGHDPMLREPSAQAVRLSGGTAQRAHSGPEFDRAVAEAVYRARRNFLRGHPS